MASDSESPNNTEILDQLEKLSKEQERITNYLVILNEYILATSFNSTEIFSNSISALQTGQKLMEDRIKQIKNVTLQTSKPSQVAQRKDEVIKNANEKEDMESSNIFAKFPHSALVTPLPTCPSTSDENNSMVENSPASRVSPSELYEKISAINGKAVFTRNFISILKSPAVSIVDESRSSSRMDKSSLSSTYSTPIIRRNASSTPVSPDNSRKSRRAAAPVSLKEPSLKKKMRRL